MGRKVIIVGLTAAALSVAATWVCSYGVSAAAPKGSPVQAITLIELERWGLGASTRRGSLSISYQCPSPFTWKADGLTTIVEWWESLSRPTREPICSCGNPWSDHASECDETQLFIFPSFGHRNAELGPLRWSATESPWSRLCRVTAPLCVMFAALSFYPTLVFIRGPLRRRYRHRRGLCRTCGYNLTGNTSGVCPECGEPT